MVLVLVDLAAGEPLVEDLHRVAPIRGGPAGALVPRNSATTATTTNAQNATMAMVMTIQPPQPMPSWYQPIIVLSSFASLGGSTVAPPPRASRSRSCEGLLKKPRRPGLADGSRGPGCHHGGMGDDVSGGRDGRGGPAAGARPQSGLRAMVVEDETQLAGLIGSYLERDGFEVSLVHDGHEAVATAREVDPDVVVLDLGLPSLDGVEVCRQLRTFSDAYVVMLTARSDEVDTLIGLSVGADDYMTKPFSPRELVARVQAMLRRPRPPGSATDALEGREPSVRWSSTPWVATCGSTGSRWRSPAPSSTCSPPCPSGRGWRSAAASSSTPCGARPGSATSTWSTCTSATCAASSATTPPQGRFVRTVRGVGYRMGTGQ